MTPEGRKRRPAPQLEAVWVECTSEQLAWLDGAKGDGSRAAAIKRLIDEAIRTARI